MSQRSSAPNKVKLRDRILPSPRTFNRWAFSIVLVGVIISTANSCGVFDAIKDKINTFEVPTLLDPNSTY